MKYRIRWEINNFDDMGTLITGCSMVKISRLDDAFLEVF